MVQKTLLLANTTVIGKRTGANIVEMKPIDDGPNLHWNVTIRLPEWYTKDHSRLIFQPMVINCEEEDTIQYLEPLVFEGKQYHKNQIRRKSFDTIVTIRCIAITSKTNQALTMRLPFIGKQRIQNLIQTRVTSGARC